MCAGRFWGWIWDFLLWSVQVESKGFGSRWVLLVALAVLAVGISALLLKGNVQSPTNVGAESATVAESTPPEILANPETRPDPTDPAIPNDPDETPGAQDKGSNEPSTIIEEPVIEEPTTPQDGITPQDAESPST